jgi:hypothetical protein
MKVTKRQLTRIIKEEKAKLTREAMGAAPAVHNPGRLVGLFDVDFMYDLLVDEVENYLHSSPSGKLGGLSKTEADMLRKAMNTAINNIIEDYGQ